MKRLNLLITAILLLPCLLKGQERSVLSEGSWLKMAFTEPGAYRINWNTLHDMGWEPSDIDPRNLAIYGNPGGMLPQSSDEPRPIDLIENPIVVSGEADGVFGENDFLLFLVDEINQTQYNSDEDQFEVIKNLYSDTLYYFLTIKDSPGLRIQNSPNLGNDNPLINVSRQLIAHESDEVNLLSSGREWLGEQLNAINSIDFQHQAESLADNGSIKITSEFVTQAYVETSLDVNLNDNLIGELNFQTIPNSQYAVKGNIQAATFEIGTDQVGTSNLDIEFIFDQNGANSSVTYLNKYLIDLPIESATNGSSLKLRYPPANQGISTYQLNSTSTNLTIWDITNPSEVINQEYIVNGNNISFGAFSQNYREFLAFDPNLLPEPEVFSEISNQNLRGSSDVEFVIITHISLKNEAQRLANFRKSNDGISTLVATTQEIYNEFSSGRQDITAIRDFIKHKYDQSGKLKYVLLFGKGSFDYKNRIENNTNLVPTYESRNSIHPLLTFSSDDYFAFLDSDEGYWEETSAGDHLMDVGVGRIPAKDIGQAKKAVDKIILYQTDPNTLGDWKSRIMFVADDGDRNIHQRDADQLATLVDTTHQQFQVRKLYLDSFEQERTPNGEFSESAEQALIDAVNEGRLIINFTGHGAEFGWMQERILTFDLMEEWRNPYKLPFLITATCEFGRNDDPTTESGAERLMFKSAGGAIGLLTTARPVFSSTNYRLNEALYGTMLKQENGEYQRLGDVIKFTKNNSLQGSLNRNFILLGDPSMKLAYPEKEIEITSINGNMPTTDDTLRALQPVTIVGNIKSNGQSDSSFDGEITFNLFDKSQDKTTRGSDNDPFYFNERDRVLFRGRASVNQGEFELQFIVPKNIDYAFGAGKMLVYSTEGNLSSEALGSSLDFTLGGTYESASQDLLPPTVRIFLNDTTSEISGIYDNQVKAIIKLSDQSGINISDAVLGQNLTLTLNDSLSINLNDFYYAEVDDFTKGIAEIQLNELPAGVNQITVTARDIYGNSGTSSVEFTVEQKTSFITEIKSYPNPFIDETFFSVTHELEGENLELNVEILNTRGQIVQNLSGEILSAEETVVVNWDGKNHEGQKLEAGIYFYTFRIISNTSGKSDLVRRKLIISN